jgi:NADH-quinone oxidoreductase subunit E
MKAVFLFFLMIIAAVFLGLAIAFWYVTRFVENGGPVRKPPRAVPFPRKHAPVDVTPKLTDLSRPQFSETAKTDGADVDGLMRRLDGIKAESVRQRSPADKAADQQPQPLDSNRDGEKDDLKRISGIGPKLEGLLNTSGIVSFHQIAEWQDADIQSIDELLGAFKGRVRRDDWVEQARRLIEEKGSAP